MSDEEPAWPPTAVSAGAQANLEEAEALLAALALLAGERKRKAAFALADLLNRRGLERPCEVLVQWARENSRKSCSPAAALPQAFRLRFAALPGTPQAFTSWTELATGVL